VNYAIKYLARAQAEIKRANDWWLAHRDKAPNAFANDLLDAERRITTQPGIGAPIRNAARPNTRRLLLPTTGYHLYYRVFDATRTVHVIALWHSSRQPPRSISKPSP